MSYYLIQTKGNSKETVVEAEELEEIARTTAEKAGLEVRAPRVRLDGGGRNGD